MDTTQNHSDVINTIYDTVDPKDVVIENGVFALSPESFALSTEQVLRAQTVMQNYVNSAVPNVVVGVHDSFDFALDDVVTQAHMKVAEEAMQATLKGEFLGVPYSFGGISQSLLEEKIRELGISPELLNSNAPAFSCAALSGRGTFAPLHTVDELGYRKVVNFEMLGVSIVSPDSVVDEACRIGNRHGKSFHPDHPFLPPIDIAIPEKLEALGIDRTFFVHSELTVDDMLTQLREDENTPIAELLPEMKLGDEIPGLIAKRLFDYELIGGL